MALRYTHSNGWGNYWIVRDLWADDDQTEALQQGWRLQEANSKTGPTLVVQAYEQGSGSISPRPRFHSDQAALAFVESKADQGSPLHEKALMAMTAYLLRGKTDDECG